MGIRHRLRPLGNGELETYTSSRANSFLDGHGDLVNRVTKSTAPIGHVTYASTRLVTREKFNQAQGHWEGRIMVTPEAGVWPAWWALGTSKPWAAGGEISITFSFDGTLHDDRPNPRPGLAIWPRQALLHDHQHCGHKLSAAGSPAGPSSLSKWSSTTLMSDIR